MSLKRRCAKIADHTNMQYVVTGQTLGNFYRKHNVRNLKVHYTIYTPQTTLSMISQQQYFVKSLAQEMLFGKEVIYLDECTVNLWQHSNRTWQRPSERIKQILPQTRERGVTVFGAIISNSDRFYSKICFGGTTGQSTLLFLKHLEQEIGRLRFGNSVLVMDKARGHTALDVKDFLATSGITVMFMPSASSPLNSVERVWSLLKRHFQQRLFETCGSIQQLQLIETVEEIIRTHIDGNCLDFANGNKQVWLTVLGGQRV